VKVKVVAVNGTRFLDGVQFGNNSTGLVVPVATPAP
jgi:hypothetical protein